MTTSKTSIVRDAVKYQEETIKSRALEFKALKRELKKFDESKFPEGTNMWVDYYSASIQVPWGLRNLRQARVAIGRGWEHQWQNSEADGSISHSYRKRIVTQEIDRWGDPLVISIHLTIRMSAAQLPEGSCQRILVSEETKTYVQKTYKVVCSDGGMETQLSQVEEEFLTIE